MLVPFLIFMQSCLCVTLKQRLIVTFSEESDSSLSWLRCGIIARLIAFLCFFNLRVNWLQSLHPSLYCGLFLRCNVILPNLGEERLRQLMLLNRVQLLLLAKVFDSVDDLRECGVHL